MCRRLFVMIRLILPESNRAGRRGILCDRPRPPQVNLRTDLWPSEKNQMKTLTADRMENTLMMNIWNKNPPTVLCPAFVSTKPGTRLHFGFMCWSWKRGYKACFPSWSSFFRSVQVCLAALPLMSTRWTSRKTLPTLMRMGNATCRYKGNRLWCHESNVLLVAKLAETIYG